MSLKTAKFWLFCVLSLLAFGVMSDVEAAPITFDYDGGNWSRVAHDRVSLPTFDYGRDDDRNDCQRSGFGGRPGFPESFPSVGGSDLAMGICFFFAEGASGHIKAFLRGANPARTF